MNITFNKNDKINFKTIKLGCVRTCFECCCWFSSNKICFSRSWRNYCFDFYESHPEKPHENLFEFFENFEINKSVFIDYFNKNKLNLDLLENKILEDLRWGFMLEICNYYYNDQSRYILSAMKDSDVKKEINDKTQEFVADNFGDPKIADKLFKDLGDSFTFDQSMRTWYATANTQVPNDQNAFAEYCYGDMVSCKEGNEFACAQGMTPRWTNY